LLTGDDAWTGNSDTELGRAEYQELGCEVTKGNEVCDHRHVIYAGAKVSQNTIISGSNKAYILSLMWYAA
jgi:hypothetical protein